ncbi:hypothetical protein [Bdellovibrio svalbardensis]|uniref:Uncharacterized protein n=1 Tax=Bdellovibrio svalbardensis TaxID=2972972 RepID=A0ABT6DDN3_9BACT|nr:hypothetical protein [Bdellovibrio svalbardensis]MDG0814903.1 hypothetical protein [Bdellovibrio svalbardensis]
MKKIDQLMQDLGFNKNAPDSVKEAFIKHLIKASTGVNVITPSEKREIEENPTRIVQFKTPQQLSFGFVEEEIPKPKTGKKAVS